MRLAGSHIVLGVTGGIAAYKSAYLTRLLIKAGAEVQVIMTEAATKFVTPLTFESLSQREVAVDMFPDGKFVGTRHIDYADWADLIVIAPATADFIALAANGLCPNLLSTVVCAYRRKVLYAPAMNDGMWDHPAVKENVSLLRKYSHVIAGVGIGEMACRSNGPGRMAEPDELLELIVTLLKPEGDLSGKTVVVTAGPAREAIDPVRYISNRSSGKMGFTLAADAYRRGAEVILIAGPVSLETPRGVQRIDVETTAEMARAVENAFATCDYLFMAAAPADFTPAKPSDSKIKKSSTPVALDLAPTQDILASLAGRKAAHQCVVGFALETDNLLPNAKTKLKNKNLDFIVLNDAGESGAAFDSDTNHVIIISRDGFQKDIPKMDKLTCARAIIDHILAYGIQ